VASHKRHHRVRTRTARPRASNPTPASQPRATPAPRAAPAPTSAPPPVARQQIRHPPARQRTKPYEPRIRRVR
jgi:hypothetical protein